MSYNTTKNSFDDKTSLAIGTELNGRYIVDSISKVDIFSVDYICYVKNGSKKVVVKEYFPKEFSCRAMDNKTVVPLEGNRGEQFVVGKAKFITDANTLKEFQNVEGLVKVLSNFEENGTAYMVTEYIEGETLQKYLDRIDKKTIPEKEAIELLMPVIRALEIIHVHEKGVFHRDISPDTIFVDKNGNTKLFDFSDARYATVSHSRSASVLNRTYSAFENHGTRNWGSYTDVYSVAATLYRMTTGQVPATSLDRFDSFADNGKDNLKAPRRIKKGLSRSFETALLNALNMDVDSRTSNMSEFIKALNASRVVRVKDAFTVAHDHKLPKWLKILTTSLMALLSLVSVLIITGVIDGPSLNDEVVIPEGIVIAPDVEGLPYDEAIELIEQNNLLAEAGGSVESEYVAPGKIILQTPVGGSYLETNGTIALMVSSGGDKIQQNVVPHIIWDTKEDAIEKIKQAGLGNPTIREVYDDTVEPGQVVSITPEPGTEVKPGTVVEIEVSLGAPSFNMPNVVGKNISEARSSLEDLGLVVSVEYEKNDSVTENSVIRQSAKANSKVQQGDQINLVVSSGESTKKVTNVVGKHKDDAVSILKKQGFKVVVLENYHADVKADFVISQTPLGGSSQVEGAQITIYVSKGRKQISVTLDACGGYVSKSRITVYGSSTYGDLPTPSRSGYTFNGWYSAKTGGVKVTSSTKVTTLSAHTLYARWTPNSYTISFNANGGSISTISKKVTYDSTYGTLPTPTRRGYAFDGWYTSESGGTRITSSTKVADAYNQTLYAHWSADSYTIDFDANGGTVDVTSKKVTYDSTYGELPVPKRAGYTFGGWHTAKTGGTKVISTTKVTAQSTHTLYARWIQKNCTVTFNANGGSVSLSSRTVTYGSTYGDLPTPTRAGYTFNGWYTNTNYTTQVTSSTKVTNSSNHTIYAKWSVNKYTLTFNANRGSVSPSSRTVTYGATYGTLPTPTRDYYTFGGWYTNTNYTTQVSSSTKMGAGNVTIYAKWTQNPTKGWVLESNVPAGAQIVDEKWTYTKTETTESTSSSLSGWTQTGNYWKQIGSGSTYYATFPSGFDTNHSTYKSFAKSPYSGYENTTSKRVVSNSWAGYVYWHWMYNVPYANVTNRTISHRYGTWNPYGGTTGSEAYGYYYFYAFTSSQNCPYLSNTYCCSQNLPSYNCSGIIPNTSAVGVGTPRFFRFDYYKSTYTDYQKIFLYKKVTTGLESSTKVTAGGQISNVQKYVKYREK